MTHLTHASAHSSYPSEPPTYTIAAKHNMQFATLITLALFTQGMAFVGPSYSHTVIASTALAAKKTGKPAPTPEKGGFLSSFKPPVPPTLPTLPPLLDGGVIGVAGKGMSLLSPIFSLEAKFQAAVTGFVGEIIGSPFRTNPDDVRADIKAEIKKNKAVIYTYDLSPFSSGALNLLREYDVEVISMGAEWFLPGLFKGPENSERRVALEEMTGSTSLPKLFVSGVCYGGFSTGGPSGGGIASLASSGKLAGLGLKKKTLSSKKRGRKGLTP